MSAGSSGLGVDAEAEVHSAREMAGGPAPVVWARRAVSGALGDDGDDVARWASRCRVAVVDAWDLGTAERFKALAPDTRILCRKHLTMADPAETGPRTSSGISYARAEAHGGWFATDRAGQRIGWDEGTGPVHLRVWDPEYRAAWVDAVTAEVRDSPFDGVLAVGDLEATPPLDLPLPDLGSKGQQREAVDNLIHAAGAALVGDGKILVTALGDARRSPDRWSGLARWGGVLEPGWMSTVGGRLLDPGTARQQADRLCQGEEHSLPEDAVAILRTPVPVDLAEEAAEDLVRYGLAAFWVFGGGRGLYAATSPDGSHSHWITDMQWDLGLPLEPPSVVVNLWSRTFSAGWVAVNLASDGRRRRHVTLPTGYLLPDGSRPPEQVVLGAHQGMVLVRDPGTVQI